MDNNDTIDTDFNEVKEDNIINGRKLYYSTSQVSQMISETDSTIRFWCSKFKDIIKIEMSGSHRKFSEDNIEKLKYIKRLLREDHFSINQVIEFAGKDIPSNEIKIQNQEPMAMKALASAIMIEVGAELEDYKLMIKEDLIQEIKQGFIDQKKLQENDKVELRDFIAVAIQDNFDNKLTELKGIIDTKEMEATKRDTEMLDFMKKNMEDRKLINTESEKKGFFKKIFGK